MYFHLCCYCNNMDCWCNSVFHLSIQVNNTLQITNYWEKWIPLISKRWLAPPAGRSRGLQQSNLWKKKSKTFRCQFDAPETAVKSNTSCKSKTRGFLQKSHWTSVQLGLLCSVRGVLHWLVLNGVLQHGTLQAKKQSAAPLDDKGDQRTVQVLPSQVTWTAVCNP